VFDYKDNWHAFSEKLQAVDEAMKEAWNAKQREWEPSSPWCNPALLRCGVYI